MWTTISTPNSGCILLIPHDGIPVCFCSGLCRRGQLTYSPNLNPIERLWKVMNENSRNNRFFKTAQEFRKAILEFFETTWPQISLKMIDGINDSFQIIKSPV